MEVNHYKRVIEPVFVTILVLFGVVLLIKVIDGQQKVVREITRLSPPPLHTENVADPVWTGSTMILDDQDYLIALELPSPAQTKQLFILLPDTETSRVFLASIQARGEFDLFVTDLTYAGIDSVYVSIPGDVDPVWVIRDNETKQVVFQEYQSTLEPYKTRGTALSKWLNEQTLVFSQGEGDGGWSEDGFVLFNFVKKVIEGGLMRACDPDECVIKPFGPENEVKLVDQIDKGLTLIQADRAITISGYTIDYQYPLDTENNLLYFDQGVELRDYQSKETFFVRWDDGIREIKYVMEEGVDFMIAQEIVSPNGRIARLLAVPSKENIRQLQNILNLGYQVSDHWFPLYLSILDEKGNGTSFQFNIDSLVAGTDQLTISLERWNDDETLVFTASLGDAGIGASQVYLYNPDTQVSTPALGYYSDGLALGGLATQISYYYGSTMNRHLVQFLDQKTNLWTPVYSLTREEIGQLQSLDDLNKHLYLFNTNNVLKVDIRSIANTRRHKEGIEVVVDGTTRFVPWDAVLYVDGPSPTNP